MARGSGGVLFLLSAVALSLSCGGETPGRETLPGAASALVADGSGSVTASKAPGAQQVCHLDSVTGLYKVLTLKGSALKGHLKHGDQLAVNGACLASVTCPCFTAAQIDATRCADGSPIDALCPADIYAQFGLQVVDGVGWSCSAGQQSGFYVVYEDGGSRCASLTATGQTNMPLNASEADGCVAVIRSSRLYGSAACI